MIKNWMVYLLKYTNDGNNVYMGSTSKSLDQCLEQHKDRAKKGEETILYSRMRETGVDKWWIVAFLTFPCDEKTIRETCDRWVGQTGSIHVGCKKPLEGDKTR